MVTNFDFLKKVDTNLFGIISEAEKLYRDEYFEQCMGQTRRFGEHVCKKVLGANRTTENTFDDMLATLKDCSAGGEAEKEFIDDLYFLKKNGNNAVHSSSVKKDGTTALECLQRAFEVAINYSVYAKGANSNILRLRFDTELLITGEKKKKTLSEKYLEAKEKIQYNNSKNEKTTKTKSKTNVKKKNKKQSSVMVCKVPKKRISLYWIFVGISLVISSVIMLIFLISI